MKRNKLRPILSLFLVVFLLCADVFPASAVTQADIDKLERSAATLSAQQKEIQAELSALTKEKKSVVKQKTLIDQQIALLGEEIANAEARVREYENLIAQTQQELADARQKEEEQYDLFCRRVRAMEERGEISYWSVLFQAADFSDFLGALDFVNELMDSDRRVIEGLRTLQTEISQKEAGLQETLRNQQLAKKELDDKRTELNTQRTAAEKLIKELQANEAEYQDVLDDIEAEQAAMQEEIVRLSRELAASQQMKTTYGGYIWPETVSKRITSPIGARYTGIPGASTNHAGIDIGGVYWDTKVLAAKDGVVIKSEYNSARGNYVVISHGSGNTTLYQHMSKRSVNVGDAVKQGDVIGITGSTGIGSGPHLHFEITENGAIVDPLKYLTDYIKAW